MDEPNATLAGIEAALRDISSRLASIEQRTERMAGLTAEVPNLIAAAGDVFDEQAARLGNAEERFTEAIALLERVSRPQTLRALHAAVELLEQAPNTLAILGDSLEEALSHMAAKGVPVDELLFGLVETGKRGVKLLSSVEFRALLDSPMLDHRMLETLGKLSQAVVETTRDGAEPLGLFGAMHAMGKTHVRKAVGFAMGVAARLGASLDNEAPVRALPAAKQHTDGGVNIP